MKEIKLKQFCKDWKADISCVGLNFTEGEIVKLSTPTDYLYAMVHLDRGMCFDCMFLAKGICPTYKDSGRSLCNPPNQNLSVVFKKLDNILEDL